MKPLYYSAANIRFALTYLLCIFIALILYLSYAYHIHSKHFIDLAELWFFTGFFAVIIISSKRGLNYTLYLDSKWKSSDDVLLDTTSINKIKIEIESRKAVVVLLTNIILLISFFVCFLSITNLIPICVPQIGIFILSTIIVFFIPICLKAIIKPIVNYWFFILPWDFVDFINHKFTFFGFKCFIFSKTWFKQRFILMRLIFLGWLVVFTLNTIYHIQFEILIFSYCFSSSVFITWFYSTITKNKNWDFIFCMFIYTLFIICISKYVFLSVLSLCSIDIYNMYNKTETKPDGKTSGSDKVYCKSNKDATVLDLVSKDKKENKILSLFGLGSKKPRTWDIPHWARGYAKGSLLYFVSPFEENVKPFTTIDLREKIFSIERNGRVAQITGRWHISSHESLGPEVSKKVYSHILSSMREKFFMKKPLQQFKTELSFEPKPKHIYTNLTQKTGYEVMLSKSKIENQVELVKKMNFINNINKYKEGYRYGILGYYKFSHTFSAPVPLFRNQFGRLEHIVGDMLDICCQLNKEIYPRIALLGDRGPSNTQGAALIINQAFNVYIRYIWNMSYIYTYYPDIYKDLASFTIPKFLVPPMWADTLESDLWDTLEDVDAAYNTTIRNDFLLFYSVRDDNVEPKDLGIVSNTFARKGIHYYYTMQKIIIWRYVLNVNTCIRDIDMGWFQGHWNEDKLSKALGFHFSRFTRNEERIYHNYTPNNVMGVSYERLLYLLNKVKLIAAKERMKLIKYNEEFI